MFHLFCPRLNLGQDKKEQVAPIPLKATMKAREEQNINKDRRERTIKWQKMRYSQWICAGSFLAGGTESDMSLA